MNRVKKFYFSPTGTTEKIVTKIAEKLAEGMDLESINNYDFTLPPKRKEYPDFCENDIVVVGVPVYAGRVPNILLDYLSGINGKGAKAVAVVLYGNRDYDDALLELRDILVSGSFDVIGAAAFIGEHSFSYKLAKDRPDKKDLEIVADFAEKTVHNIGKKDLQINVKGNPSYNKYYKPLDKDGNPVDIRRVTPKTKETCTDCKICSRVCPMGSIPEDNVKILIGICIKCGACIKKCPVHAKYFDDEDYLKHKQELEEEFQDTKEPEIFV